MIEVIQWKMLLVVFDQFILGPVHHLLAFLGELRLPQPSSHIYSIFSLPSIIRSERGLFDDCTMCSFINTVHALKRFITI